MGFQDFAATVPEAQLCGKRELLCAERRGVRVTSVHMHAQRFFAQNTVSGVHTQGPQRSSVRPVASGELDIRRGGCGFHRGFRCGFLGFAKALQLAECRQRLQEFFQKLFVLIAKSDLKQHVLIHRFFCMEPARRPLRIQVAASVALLRSRRNREKTRSTGARTCSEFLAREQFGKPGQLLSPRP